MVDFADLCVHPEMEENGMRSPISPEKPADVASYAISSSAPEAAKKENEMPLPISPEKPAVVASYAISSSAPEAAKKENEMPLPISPEKPADVASYAISSSAPEAAKKENEMPLPISPEKPADVVSPYAISSSLPEAAKKENEMPLPISPEKPADADVVSPYAISSSLPEAAKKKNEMPLPIWPEKPADVVSPYAISSSLPEAVKNDDEEFKKINHSHGEALETSSKLISYGNQSSENASIEQEVSRYQTCNGVTDLQGDKNDADCTMSNDCWDMHEDLLFEIMLRLPVASLLRFRAVSRLWCSLIDSRTFITQHYNHNSNKSCLLARHVVSSYDLDYDSKFCLLSGDKYEVYSNLDFEQPYSLNEMTILNSCNGIVSLLLNKKPGDVVLWNPATKQLKALPKSSVYHQYLSSCNGMIVEYGFGFDAKKNDYRFVRILYCYQNKRNNLVEIYDLRSDSWKTIHKDDVLPFHHIDCDVATCKKGTCFWIGYDYDDEISPILISLDVHTEGFETMPLPGECDPNYYRYTYNALHLLNDKLCYIQSVNLGPCDVDHICFEIWMLDENGVKVSWKKICRFRPTGSSEMEPTLVLGFSKNGLFLLLGYWYRCSELYLSDFDAREEEYLALQNLKPLPSKHVCYYKLQNPNPIILEFVHFNESLVSLKRKDDGAYK